MPLIFIIGNPCSDKTKLAVFLKNKFMSKGHDVFHLCDENYFRSFDKKMVYSDPCELKLFKEYIKSEVERKLSPDNIFILDTSSSTIELRKKIYRIVKEKSTIHCSVECNYQVDVKENMPSTSSDSANKTFSLKYLRIYNRWDNPYFYFSSNFEKTFTEINKFLFENVKPKRPVLTSDLSEKVLFQVIKSLIHESSLTLEPYLEKNKFKGLPIWNSDLEVNFKKLPSESLFLYLDKTFENFIKKNPVAIESLADNLVEFLNKSDL